MSSTEEKSGKNHFSRKFFYRDIVDEEVGADLAIYVAPGNRKCNWTRRL
jgi:hypothetical protein